MISAMTIQPDRSFTNDFFVFQGLSFGPIVVNNQGSPCLINFSTCDIGGGISDVSSGVDTWQINLSKCYIRGTVDLQMRFSCQIDSCTGSGQINVGTRENPVLQMRGCSLIGAGVGSAIGAGIARGVIDGNTLIGYEQGIGVVCAGDVTVTNNLVQDCGFRGIAVNGVDALIADNVVRRSGPFGGMDLKGGGYLLATRNVIDNCPGGGMFVTTDANALVADNLVLDSESSGITVYGPVNGSVSIAGNTIGDNGGDGIVWNASIEYGGSASLVRNIGYANRGYGIRWARTGVDTVGCNDWFGNVAGDVSGLPANPLDLSLNPQFCDPAGKDFHLLATSPLAVQMACGRIGALGVGCAVTATIVSRFEGLRVPGGIRITWEIVPDPGGTAVWLERSETGVEGPWIRPLVRVSHAGSATVEFDQTARIDRTYWYRLVSDGVSESRVIAPPIAVRAVSDLAFRISQPRPNPSSRLIYFDFALKTACRIRVDILDLQGRLVDSPVAGLWSPGTHTVQWARSRSRVQAGVYVIRYRYPGGEQTQRAVLLP